MKTLRNYTTYKLLNKHYYSKYFRLSVHTCNICNTIIPDLSFCSRHVLPRLVKTKLSVSQTTKMVLLNASAEKASRENIVKKVRGILPHNARANFKSAKSVNAFHEQIS